MCIDYYGDVFFFLFLDGGSTSFGHIVLPEITINTTFRCVWVYVFCFRFDCFGRGRTMSTVCCFFARRVFFSFFFAQHYSASRKHGDTL